MDFSHSYTFLYFSKIDRVGFQVDSVCFKTNQLGWHQPVVDRDVNFPGSRQEFLWARCVVASRFLMDQTLAGENVTICAIGSINSHYFHIIGDGKINPSP